MTTKNCIFYVADIMHRFFTGRDKSRPYAALIGSFAFAFALALLLFAASAFAQTAGLPIIRIDTDGGAPIADTETWVTMTFELSDPNDPANDIAPLPNQQIRGRGNSTWVPNRVYNPYRIRFRNDQQQSPFGLRSARNWVLLLYGTRDREDEGPTLFGFEMGKRLDLQYTPTCRPVNVYLNGQFAARYLFTEHRQADPDNEGVPGRPKIHSTEGWFVEIDRKFKEEPRFRTANYDLPIMIKDPEFSGAADMTNPAYHFVREDWNELTDLMASEKFPENGYRDLVDIDAFVKYFFIQTFIRNGEIDYLYVGSTFFYKGEDGKIGAGPLWDLELSIGSRSTDIMPYPIYPWFARFFDDPIFLARYKEIWNDYSAEISSMSEFTNDSAIKDFSEKRFAYLNAEYNKVQVRPTTKNYRETSPQVFTLVSYGAMTDLSAVFQMGASSSPFEITAALTQTPTGKGGYLATISVKPKDGFAVASDVLTLSGVNQGTPFTLNVSLNFAESPMWDEHFVAVEDISNIPKTFKVGDAFYLSGMIEPLNATNKTIQWSLAEGTVGASFSNTGQTLYLSAAGEITLIARIANGTVAGAEIVDYVKSFIITVEPKGPEVSVASPDNRQIPATPPDNSAVVVPPINVLALELSVGPNPVRKSDGVVNIFVTGKRVDDGTLTVYDATGNVIRKINIRNNDVFGNTGRRVVSNWDLRDAKGKVVSEGAYLLRGSIKTIDGRREKVSVIVGVR